MNCGRVKLNNKNAINDLNLSNLLTSKKFMAFLRKTTGAENFHLDRIQSHIFHEGDFIGKHVDAYSSPSYVYSGILHFNTQYEGGEFMAYLKEEKSIKPDGFTLMLLNSTVPHEVKPITNGKRKTLVFTLDTSIHC